MSESTGMISGNEKKKGNTTGADGSRNGAESGDPTDSTEKSESAIDGHIKVSAVLAVALFIVLVMSIIALAFEIRSISESSVQTSTTGTQRLRFRLHLALAKEIVTVASTSQHPYDGLALNVLPDSNANLQEWLGAAAQTNDLISQLSKAKPSDAATLGAWSRTVQSQRDAVLKLWSADPVDTNALWSAVSVLTDLLSSGLARLHTDIFNVAAAGTAFHPRTSRQLAALYCALREKLPQNDALHSLSQVFGRQAMSGGYPVFQGPSKPSYTDTLLGLQGSSSLGGCNTWQGGDKTTAPLLDPSTPTFALSDVPAALSFDTTSPIFSGDFFDALLDSYSRQLDVMYLTMNGGMAAMDSAVAKEITGSQGYLAPIILTALLCVVSGMTLIFVGVRAQRLLLKAKQQAPDEFYTRVEDRPRPIRRYVEILLSCALRDGDAALGGEINGISLEPVLSFVRRLRPYLAQASLGEIEGVTLSGNTITSKGLTSGGAISEEQALKELQLRELRSEVGMQTVSGVVMCVSLQHHCALAAQTAAARAGSIHAPAPEQFGPGTGGVRRSRSIFGSSFGVPAQLDALTTHLQVVTHLVNCSGGVILTVAGDAVTCLWNVAAASHKPHARALDCALKLLSQTAGPGNTLSPLRIGISQSLLCAGNVELQGEKHEVVVTGPAMIRSANGMKAATILGVELCVDDEMAEHCKGPHIPSSIEHSIREGITIQSDNEDAVCYWAVHRYKMRSERLKAWHTAYQELKSLRSGGSLNTAKTALASFMQMSEVPSSVVKASLGSTLKLTASSPTKGSGSGPLSISQDPVAAFWDKALMRELVNKGAGQSGLYQM
jgi:hypothetical protein